MFMFHDERPDYIQPRLHGNSDPDTDPDWLRLHRGKLYSNPDSDHLSHVDCDPDSNLDLGPGARVNEAYAALSTKPKYNSECTDPLQFKLDPKAYKPQNKAIGWFTS